MAKKPKNIMKKENKQKNTENPKKTKILSGKVVSDKMKDTIVVLVDSYKKHPMYGKYMGKHKKFKAHDQGNKCKIGDIVRIKETRPISKDKHFIVI